MNLFENNTIISIPSGLPNLPDLSIDLTAIVKVEQRKRELAYVNKETAYELMYSFNEAYCDCLKLLTRVSYEFQRSQTEINKRKAVVLLDIIPAELVRRNLATAKSPTGSEDFRTAILNLDEDYQRLIDRSQAIKAFYELIKIKAKGFEMAFQSVKKVFDASKTIPDITSRLNAGSEDRESDEIGIAKFDF